MSEQILSLGRFGEAAAAVRGAWKAENVLPRLWAREAALWKVEPEHTRIIANSLGWLGVTGVVLPHLGELAELAVSVRADGFRDVVLLGMGGSSLCTEVVRCSDLPRADFPRMHVLDSTVPAAVARVERSVDPARTLFIVASKSGGTAETAAFYAYFYDLVRKLKGDRAGENFVAITDPGTAMEASARRDGFREVRLNPSDIGGRYSALSYFGLLPAALMGVDLKAYLNRADAAIALCRPEVPVDVNPAAQLGAALGALAQHGRDKVTLVTPPPLGALGLWIEQLVAESTGKEGRGIVPIAGEALGDPSVYGDDRVFVVVRTADARDPDRDARLKALHEAGHPVIEHILPSSLALGAEFFRWELATALAGKVLGINPFDQPNVQESKDYTNALLARFEQTGSLPDYDTIAMRDGVRVETDARNAQRLLAGREAAGLEEVLQAHLASVRPGDYVAITQFFDETPEREQLVQRLRLAIRDRLKVATTTGYGPRFLHSTGQLHKGGADNGVFLQLVADDGEGQPIPGRPYDFGTLVRAQALGDFQSLSERGRRALRVHLGGDVLGGLAVLNQAIGEGR